MNTIPEDFKIHTRSSPATKPWEPLYARQRSRAIDLLFEVREPHCNSRGFLHGGVLTALCDNTMGMSLAACFEGPRHNIVTISLTIDFIGSANVGDVVLIEPSVIRAGKSIGFCEALIYCGDTPCTEAVIARANANFKVRSVGKKV